MRISISGVAYHSRTKFGFALHVSCKVEIGGVVGNRTQVSSLRTMHSTTELTPHGGRMWDRTTTFGFSVRSTHQVYDPPIEIGGCLVGIYSTVSPTSDASTHYVREPVLRTRQDHLPAYQAIGKVHERGGFGPPTPKTNSCALKRSYLSGN